MVSPSVPPTSYPPAAGPFVGWRTGPAPAGRRESVVVGIAVALLVTAVTISTLYSRRDGDLDLSNFAVGLVATLVLLGVAVAAGVLVTDPVQRAALAGWPAAFGSISVALMVAVAMDANGASAWLGGLLIVAISAGGYWFVREAALTLSAVVGLAVLYAKFLDFIGAGDWIGDGDNALMFFGAVVLVFTLAVTAASFFTPHRALIGVTVGVATTVFYASAVVAVSVASFVTAAFSSGLDGESEPEPLKEFHNDIYVMLLFSAILIAVWAWCAYVTGNPGYRLIIIGLTASMLVASMVVLSDDHPSIWGLVIVVIGTLVMALVVLRTMGRGPGARRDLQQAPSAPPAPSGPPSAPPSGPPTTPPTSPAPPTFGG